MPRKITINIEFMAQAWFVTSEQIPGLLVSAGNPIDALREAAAGISVLALACEMERADGAQVGSMFSSTVED